MKITPEIIPHKYFHLASWLSSGEKPAWYYFMKRKKDVAIRNPFFLSTVDRPLEKLVKILHDKNILTTPSCSGHRKDRKELEGIYAVLEEDKKKINQKGLLLQDIETGSHYLFRDLNYRLPWNKNEFIRRVMQRQKNGIIGLRLNKKEKVAEKIRQLRFPGSRIYEKDNIIFISTLNSIHWRRITAAVKKIIQDCSA